MSKKKVLIVVNYFYPYISGVSEYAREVANKLSLNYEVTVLTGKHEPNLPDTEQCTCYTIVRAKPIFFIDKGYISTEFIILFRRLAIQSDVVNLHLPMLESGLLCLLTSRPLLITYQCDMAIVGGALSRLAVLAVRLSMCLAIVRSNMVVVLSKDYALSSSMLKKHRSKLIEIAPPNRFESKSLINLNRSKNKKLICGFVGRFVVEKGIDIIVEAAKILKNEPIEFLLAGEHKSVAGGSVYENLRHNIEELSTNVRILGRLSDEDMIDFYSNIDVLLLPSTNRYEAFGMVQMEAMNFGATVVTSDMPGVRETVNKTKIGQLCVPGSATSLADAILRARIERNSVSREDVRAAIQREFSNYKFEEKYSKVISDLIYSQN